MNALNALRPLVLCLAINSFPMLCCAAVNVDGVQKTIDPPAQNYAVIDISGTIPNSSVKLIALDEDNQVAFAWGGRFDASGVSDSLIRIWKFGTIVQSLTIPAYTATPNSYFGDPYECHAFPKVLHSNGTAYGEWNGSGEYGGAPDYTLGVYHFDGTTASPIIDPGAVGPGIPFTGITTRGGSNAGFFGNRGARWYNSVSNTLSEWGQFSAYSMSNYGDIVGSKFDMEAGSVELAIWDGYSCIPLGVENYDYQSSFESGDPIPLINKQRFVIAPWSYDTILIDENKVIKSFKTDLLPKNFGADFRGEPVALTDMAIASGNFSVLFKEFNGNPRYFVWNHTPTKDYLRRVVFPSSLGGLYHIKMNSNGIIAAIGRPNAASTMDHALLLVPCDMAVDANRDGIIKFAGSGTGALFQGIPLDRTEENKPFRFWINDDDDHVGITEKENVPVLQPDCQDDQIEGRRDLEDFARLHIHIPALREELANGTLQLGLKWRDANGTNPKVKVYKSADVSGSDSYVKDDAAAIAQVSGTFRAALGEVSGLTPLVLPKELFAGQSNSDSKKCLLFEGSGEGRGQLCITIHKADDDGILELIGEAPGVWLNIANIKKMYERVDSATANPWEPDQFEVDPNEKKEEAVIFVHGWRMSPEGAGSYSEIMFKRFWHYGFKGRFIAFHWDTYWFNNWEWVNDLGGGFIAPALAHYNDSEYIAWHAASQLKAFVNEIPFTSKNIFAHSMGNIVAGEALRQGMQVNNYVLMNAAVPAACYDEDEQRIRQRSQYLQLSFTMWDSPTPDDDADSATRDMAYRGTFKNISENATLINFYLPDDQATSFGWEINNDQTKPPMYNYAGGTNASLVTNFEYSPSGQPAKKLMKFLISSLYPSYYISHKPEAMAYACRTWGKAVGAFGATEGSISPGNSVDLSKPDFGSPKGFDTEHSAQFGRNIQKLRKFLETLMDELEVERNSP